MEYYAAFAVLFMGVLAFWPASNKSAVQSRKSTDGVTIPTVTDDMDEDISESFGLPRGFAAPKRMSDDNTPTIRTIQLHANGGNYPLGVFNATKANFQQLGVVYNRQGQLVKSFEAIGEDSRLWHGPPKAGLHTRWQTARELPSPPD